MPKICFTLIFLFFSFADLLAQKEIKNNNISAEISTEIEAIITAKSAKSFNGMVLISENGKVIYSKIIGFSDADKKTPLKENDQFVIGSISKQITAVLVLREVEKKRLDLHIPIRKYLPNLTQTWADSVTTHHLLTHTHGITALDKPLSFSAGTKYAYSQLGYELLSKIIEKTSGKSFEMLSNALFRKCKMNNSFHPITSLEGIIPYKNLVKGYTEQENGALAFETKTMQNHVAAGSFISTTEDLILWNKNLHNGKLLSKKIYNTMITKQKNATREHPLFGKTDYGYGITIENLTGKPSQNKLKLGQTGFAPGFVSMNYYYPEKKISVIVLCNVVWDSQDLKKAFYYHTEILRILNKFVLN